MAVCISFPRTRRALTASAAITALACVAPAGIAALTPGQAKAQECGPLPAVGTLLCPTASYPTGIDYSGVAGDILIDLDATSDVVETVVLDATGDVVFTAQGDTTITSDTGEGVVATAGDLVDLTLDSVETSADNGVGVLADAGGDANLTVDQILTSGDDADAVNITSGDAITVSAGTLSTSGDDSDAVELVSLSGPVSLDADVLETRGEASSGAVVEAVGDTDVSVGVLSTQGFQAVGLDLSADPAACVILGAGACDTDFDVGQLTTSGDGGTGALVRGVGNVTGSVDLLSTEGDDAPGIDIAVDPDVCLVIGAANCAVTVDAGDVDTGGDDSGGVVVVTPGPVDVDAGDVETDGDNSDGVHVEGGDEPVMVEADTITTHGDNSQGVDVVANGPIDVGVGTIVTEGDGSEGVLIDGGGGDVTVDVGSTTTSGSGSDGINTSTTSGDTMIHVGDVTTTGPGSDGIEADSATGDIVIVISDDINATADGANADTGGSVDVTVGGGADVFGGDDGLDLTSGTGTTVTNNGSLEGGTGMAINAHGAAAMIDNNGTIRGGVSLTGNGDTLTNDGMFMADEDSDFGAGTDTFTNNGEVSVMGDVAFTGLEQFNNNGLIDMVDGAADDSLTLPGDFTGGTNSQLAVDVDLGSDGTPADMLVIAGDADGTTAITVNDISTGPAVLNPDGVLIVDAGGAADGAFVLDGGMMSDGFVDFDLMSDAGQVRLVGSPNQSVFELSRTTQVAQDFWYASADAWEARAAQVQRGRGGRGEAWGYGYGFDRTHDGEREMTAFGVASARNLTYDNEHRGVQLGVDWGSEGSYWGLTGGFGDGQATFDATGHTLDIDGYNLGVYGGFMAGGLRADLLAKAEWFNADWSNRTIPYNAHFDGRSWGAEGEIAYRMGSDLYVEPQVSLAYVRTTLDGFDAPGGRVEFDDADSLRGKAGVRAGFAGDGFRPFAALQAVHEFKGENQTTFSSGGFDLTMADEPDDTYGLVTVGADADLMGLNTFVAADGAFGDVEGWGLKLGVRASW